MPPASFSRRDASPGAVSTAVLFHEGIPTDSHPASEVTGPKVVREIWNVRMNASFFL